MAVTQNFVSPANLAAAVRWQALGAGERGPLADASQLHPRCILLLHARSAPAAASGRHCMRCSLWLCAGSMFDPHLAAAYLRLRQQADQVAGGNAETAGQVEGSIAAAEEAARPAKRRRDGSAPRVGQAAPEQGGEEEGEALAAAAEHLAELDLGFSKDSLLGPWLRLMLQHEEQRGASEGVGACTGVERCACLAATPGHGVCSGRSAASPPSPRVPAAGHRMVHRLQGKSNTCFTPCPACHGAPPATDTASPPPRPRYAGVWGHPQVLSTRHAARHSHGLHGGRRLPWLGGERR